MNAQIAMAEIDQKQIPEKEAASPKPTLAPRVKKADPYRLGWREEMVLSSDGIPTRKRTPLTIHDILHPKVGDFRVHTDEHQRICTYLFDAIAALVEDDPHAVVLHDTRIAWDVEGIEAHGPDIAIIFNVREHQDWATFEVSEEETRPSLIIEVTSPGTRTVDLDTKVTEYEMVGVPYYVVVDLKRVKKEIVRTLIGYEMTPDGYLEVQPDAKGRLLLQPLKVFLAFEGNQLVLFDLDGNRLLTYKETVRARRKAEAQAKQAEEKARLEAARSAELEARLQQVEAELRRIQNQS